MELKISIFLAFFLPIAIASIIILLTLYYQIKIGTNEITNYLQNIILEDKNDGMNLIMAAIQKNMQSDYQSLTIFITAINSLFSRIGLQNSSVIQNSHYKGFPLNEFNMEEYQNILENRHPYNLQILTNNTSSYYTSYTNQYSKVNQKDQNFLNIANSIDSLIYPLKKIISLRNLNITSIFIIEIESGTTYDYPNQSRQFAYWTSFQKLLEEERTICTGYQPGKYPYEFRCSQWFIETNQQTESVIIFTKPQKLIDSDTLVSTLCVKSFDFKRIICIDYLFIQRSSQFSNNDVFNKASFYIVSAGSTYSNVHPNAKTSNLLTISQLEFLNTQQNPTEIKEFQQKTTPIFMARYNSSNCFAQLDQEIKQTNRQSYKKDDENYYLFVKAISTCQKDFSDVVASNNYEYSIVRLSMQANSQAYLVFSMKEDDILVNVDKIESQISLILILDQIVVIAVIIIMVYQVFTFTFAISGLIIQPVDHLITCLRQINGDQIELVYDQLSFELVDQNSSDKTTTQKNLKQKSQSLTDKYYSSSTNSDSNDSSDSSSSSDSSLSSSDSEEEISNSHKNDKGEVIDKKQVILTLKKKIQEEAKIAKQYKQLKKPSQIPPDLLLVYRVLYEIIHVIKEANKNFLEGNEEQALITYSKSINFFKTLKNENAVSICLNNMGNVYMKQKQYVLASEKYSESLKFVVYQRKQLRELYKANISEQVLHTDEQYRYFSSLIISRSFHLVEALMEAIEEKQKDAMKFLGLSTVESCYSAIKERYEEIKQEVKVYNAQRSSFDPMVAHILLQLSVCSIEMKRRTESIMFLEETEDEIAKEPSPEYPFHLNVPKKILLTRILYLKGYFNVKKGSIYIGALFLTKSIENGRIYCPKIRRKALLILRKLFNNIDVNRQLSTFSGVDYLLDKYRPQIKDLLFISNVSASMGSRDKILVASQTILLIYLNYVQKKFDRVGYYVFKESMEQVFPLQRVDKSWDFLENVLRHMPTVSNGTGCVTNALSEALNIFNNNQYLAHCYDSSNNDLSYKKFILLFTDSADVLSQTINLKKRWEKTKENLKYSGIILVIFAFTDSQETMNSFKEMVDYSQDGFVIHYKDYKTVQSYFQNLTETYVQDSYEIEEIS